MTVTGDDLTRLLADRFHRIVPQGFYVRAEGGLLVVGCDPGISPFAGGSSGSHVGHNFDLEADTLEERVVRAADQAINDLQDFVDEASTEPWPGTRTVPEPHAEVMDGQLHLWFGDRDDPVLECEPINL